MNGKPVDMEKIEKASDLLLPDVRRFLTELMKFPSTPGKENDAMEYLYSEFSELNVDVEKISLSNDIKNDPDYSNPIPDIEYDGRFNIRICKKGNGKGEKLLLNAHVDVVPPSDGMENPWSGIIRDGIVYGRGACDDKGAIAAIYLLFRLLEETGSDLAGDVIAHLVVEEENGGNGSLAMIREGESADGCIVLEPTENKVLTSIRGAVWFRIEFFGKAGHSGQVNQTKSALLMAKEAIDILINYHRDLLTKSRGVDLFGKYENPMPITFGRLETGNWPASAPNHAILEGVLGFLPNKTKEQICREIKSALLNESEILTEDNFNLSFTYKHDCSVVSPAHELPQGLIIANKSCGIKTGIDAMTASCDAWFYNNQLEIPTVVYGPGALSVAHSKDENIRVSEIVDVARVLYVFVNNYYRPCK